MNSISTGGVKGRYRGNKYRHDIHNLAMIAVIGPDGNIYGKSYQEPFKMGSYYIHVYEYENTKIPHIHFTPYGFAEQDMLKKYKGLNMAHGKAKHSDQANWLEGGILLLEPKYFPHDRKDRTLNTFKERDNFASFFKAESNWCDDDLGRRLTWWEVLVSKWDIYADERIIIKYDAEGRAIQPDYSELEVVPFKLK